MNSDQGNLGTPPPPLDAGGRLREVAWVFAKLGTIAFGGPAAHVAMMEEEVVRRRGWVTRQEFLDLYSATNFIPGPNSTEMAIHLGYRRAGWAGLLTGGVCFISPAVVIVTVCAWAYVRYGSLPLVEGVFRAVAPVIVGVVAHALWRLGQTALVGKGKGPLLWLVAALAAIAVVLGVHELVVLGAAGVVMGVDAARSGGSGANAVDVPRLGGVAPLLGGTGGVSVALAAPTTGGIFWIFAKIGSVLFGSGYVLLAFLRAELVERRGWLSEQQLLDAVSVGQFTPGPLFTTATFIGYLLRGVPGAGAATAGIFLPAFVFVALTAPMLPWLRRSRVIGGMLDGVNAASLALMVVVLGQLARASLTWWWPALLAVAATVALWRWKINSAWLVLGAAALGLLLHVLGWTRGT